MGAGAAVAEMTMLEAVADRLREALLANGGAARRSGRAATGEDAISAATEARDGALTDLDLRALDRTLQGLCDAASLDPASRLVLSLLALVNLDDRVGRGIGLLHDDLSRTRPSVGLLARVLGPLASRRTVLESAGPDGEPARLGLVSHAGPYGDLEAPIANRELVLHPRVWAALLEGGVLRRTDSRSPGVFHLLRPGIRGGDVGRRPADTLDRLAACPLTGRRPGLLCAGPDFGVALRYARDFAVEGGLAVLRIDVDAALALGRAPESLANAVRRESLLLQALPVWADLPADLLDEPRLARRLAVLLVEAPAPLIVHAARPWTPPTDVPLTLVQVPAPLPGYRERIELWDRRSRADEPLGREGLEGLAMSFVLPEEAIEAARFEAEVAGILEGGPLVDRLRAAAHRQASARLVRFATRIRPRARWADLVAPPSVVRLLHEVEWRAAHRIRVMEESGFARTASGRRGFVALFHGPSGTGKTLATEIIAGARGFDLYKVDLSALVSKYIGETEKHLSQVFEDAESSRAILFFDEADSVFGKRSEVRDAHDRYANLEVNYLLQRIEAYDGVVVLATNMRQNMDDAFLRRLDLVVEFPFPDEAARAEIWRRVWPASVGMGPDIDLDVCARRFRLSGGSIRNAAIDATYRAAARNGNGGRIRVARIDLMAAIGREYQKMGRPVARGEFGSDFDRVVATLFADGTKARE